MTSKYHEHRHIPRLQDARGPTRITQIIQSAPMPVYGLSGQPLGLTACSGIQWEQSAKDQANNTVSSVEFRFVLPFSRSKSNNFRTGNFTIRSTAPEEPWLMGNPTDILREFSSDPNLAFKDYGWRPKERAQARSPQIVEQQFIIADLPFSGAIAYWSQPHQLAVYALTHEGTTLGGRITGKAFRLSLPELRSLLEQLVIVNDRPELLAQYEAECKQNS